MRLFLAGACAAVMWATSANSVWAALSTTDWVCEVVYTPSRQVWPRTVRWTHDDRRLKAIAIDGVPVYQFAVMGSTVLTALDNERVRLDAATRTWSSDFRGQAQGEGRCDVAAE